MSWWEPGHVDSDAEPSLPASFRLEDALANLTAKQRFVVELRFGLKDGELYTQDEIAECMGITQQAVSLHEQQALHKLNKQRG